MDDEALAQAIREPHWGSLVRFAREARGVDQFSLAYEMSCSQSVLSRWERQGNVPTVRTLCRVAAYAGVTLAVTMRPDHGQPMEIVFDGIGFRRRAMLLRRVAMLSREAEAIRGRLGLL